MRCEDYESHFQLFVDDELTAKEKSAFEEHIRSCLECKQRLDSLVHMTSLVGEMKDYRVPITFNRRVLSELGFGVVPAWFKMACAAAVLLAGGWVSVVALWVRGWGASQLTGLVKSVLGLPQRLVVIGKVLDPIVVLMKAGATVLRSLGGPYILTLSLALLGTLFVWWLVNQRFKPVKVLSLI